ncbi:hypothetical protein [uncultured Thiodictyon sp.]|uniref:hypothetical protein n=1 Tax=uncultured Thiodictyon sp. TaxID=1846217 RepID=UPI0025F524B3|nr:hypothetical protein [uncultured Thiodictyon sp.]
MRNFTRRFGRGLRTMPRRIRWMLMAPVTFIALLIFDARMAISAFLVVLGWLMVRELFCAPHINHHGNDERFNNATLWNHDDIGDVTINPATGFIMNGITDGGGNIYGHGDNDH